MESNTQDRIAITGVSGHLGYVIHQMFRRDGIAHCVFLRKKVDYIDHDDVVIGSLYDDDTIAELVRNCSTVIHCAAKVWPRTGRNQHVIDVNYGITRRMLEVARKEGVRHFIYFSSIHSMKTPPQDQIMDEQTSLIEDDRTPYDFSKAEAERFLADQTGMKITILNPTGIIGPGDHYLRGMNQLFYRIVHRKLPVITSGGFNIVDVRDVARAAIHAAQYGIAGKFIVGGNYIKMTELSRKYGEVNGLKVTKWVIPPWMMRLAAWISIPIDRLFNKPLAFNKYSVHTLLEGHRNISSEKAKQHLGFTNLPLEQSLKNIHEWLVSEKMEL